MLPTPGLAKQHEVVLAKIQLKLKVNPDPLKGNAIPHCLKSLRENPEPMRDNELNIIKSFIHLEKMIGGLTLVTKLSKS